MNNAYKDLTDAAQQEIKQGVIFDLIEIGRAHV